MNVIDIALFISIIMFSFIVVYALTLTYYWHEAKKRAREYYHKELKRKQNEPIQTK